jgi:hypothetical protein
MFEWIENTLQIRTKRKRLVLRNGRKVMSQIVPFHFNATQMILAQAMAWAWYEGRPHKVLTPKARQLGSSTWWQAVMYAMAVLGSGYHIATVAHTEDGVDEVFSKTKTFQKYVPDPRDLETDKEGRMTWDNESSHGTFTVKSGDALLKGPTPSAMHLTECANFADKGVDADNAIASALNAVGDSPDAIVCYESTANGQDVFFYKECERARDPRSGTENRVIFLPWFLDPEYSMSWKEYCARLKNKELPERFERTDVEEALVKKLSKVKVTKRDCWWSYRVHLTDEQLIWRRFKIANACFGKPEYFSRYYPSTYNEAFTSTVTSLFSQETIQYYMDRARPCAVRGEVLETAEGVEFKRQAGGYVQVWHRPVPGREYKIGADVGGARDNSDPCSAYVIDSHSLQVMAAVHGHLEYDHYAYKLCSLGRWYNYAQLAIENNYQPACAKVAFRIGYPNVYHYHDEASFSRGVQARPGFNTNRNTKPELVAAIQTYARDRKLDSLDVGLAREMVTFVQVVKAGGGETYKATGLNHDDRIMACAIALYLCKGEEAVADDGYDGSDPVWRAFLQRKAYLEEREERLNRARADEGGEILVL